MTVDEVAQEIRTRQREHHTEIKNFLAEQRERVDLIQQKIEDFALFSPGGSSHRQPAERALGGLPIANTYPAVERWTSQDQPAAWRKFLVSGSTGELLAANLSVDIQPAGGFLVAPQVSSRINSIAFESSPMRQICRVVPISTGDAFEEPITVRLPGAVWRGEQQTRTTTERPDLAKARAPLHEIDAIIQTTQKLLDTADYDVSNWLEAGIAQQFAISENAAFVSGDGNLKPRGFLAYPNSTAADDTRAFGALQYHVTGVNGAFAATDPANIFDDVVASLKAAYRPGAVWLASRTTWGKVRRLKDQDGNSLWQPSMQAGMPDRLLGYPILEAEDMPEIATDSLSIAFGNFQRGYTIVDGKSVMILRDPYTVKGYVLFYGTRRTGGGVWNSECIKLLKFGTS